MALGAIGTLGAIGSGISKAMPSIIEEREKELNANFVTEFHRISTSGTEEEMTQLLEDPRYSNVSPQVRQRIMETAARVADRRATQTWRKETAGRKEQQYTREKEAEGYEFTRGPSYEQQQDVEGAFAAGPPEEALGRMVEAAQDVDPSGFEVTGMEPGPEMQARMDRQDALEQARLESLQAGAGIKQIDLSLRENKLQQYNDREDEIMKVLYASMKNPSMLDYVENPRVKQEVVARLIAFEMPLKEQKTVPLAFMLRMADLRSALAELDNLDKQIVEMGGQGPIEGYLSNIPMTRARKLRAEIDRVRQRIGKALEGGVLRKEDEEKYKKILPTITDDRGTSDSKIRGLRGALERDIEILEAVFGTYSGHYETFQGNKELVSLAMSQIYADHGLVFGYARGQSFADDYLQKGSAGLGVYPAEAPGYQEQGEALPSGPPSWERGPGYR